MKIKTIRFAALIFVGCIILLLAGLAVQAIIGMIPRTTPQKQTAAAAPDPTLEGDLRTLFTALEVSDKEIRLRKPSNDIPTDVSVHIPRGIPLEHIILQISDAAKRHHYHIEDCVWNDPRQLCTVKLTAPIGRPDWRIRLARSDRFFSDAATAAIVVTDFDLEVGQTMVDMLSFPEPITVAVPPTGENARTAARSAREHGKEVILALPLESEYLTGRIPRKTQIMIQFTDQELSAALARAEADIGGPVTGYMAMHAISPIFNNSRALSTLFKEIRRHQGSFVDHEKTISTLARETAGEIGVPYLKASVTVPAGSREAMLQKLEKCAVTASRSTGMVIFVPPTRACVQALNDSREVFAENGVKLVTVSSIAAHP